MNIKNLGPTIFRCSALIKYSRVNVIKPFPMPVASTSSKLSPLAEEDHADDALSSFNKIQALKTQIAPKLKKHYKSLWGIGISLTPAPHIVVQLARSVSSYRRDKQEIEKKYSYITIETSEEPDVLHKPIEHVPHEYRRKNWFGFC